MRRRLLCVLCSLCVLCATAAAAAVADYLGRPVGSVRLVIEGRDSTEPLMMQIVGTASGQVSKNNGMSGRLVVTWRPISRTTSNRPSSGIVMM